MLTLRKFRKDAKAISPVLSVLMMITVAVAASLVTYSWVMGYLGFTTAKAGKAVQIQSIANEGGDLVIYVQNVGDGTVEYDANSTVYINGVLIACGIDNNPLSEGDTATMTLIGEAAPEGLKVTVRVVTIDGTFTEATKNF